MNKRTFCTLIASTFLAVNASAANKNNINPWEDCGIGAIIFEDNSTAAAISNVIFDLGTTAVSSQVSSEDSCNGKRVKTAQFIQDNFDQIIEETSQGTGIHLTAMLDMLEVDEHQKPEMISSIRNKTAQQVFEKRSTPQSYYDNVVASL
ncbi:DUF3015 domain-containing protein [Vibrio azureus]|nr:DUF3015 family protein [Vibrio azureus]AUI88734.1 DUF3015 domain-containing protein [Vibrio azureus]